MEIEWLVLLFSPLLISHFFLPSCGFKSKFLSWIRLFSSYASAT